MTPVVGSDTLCQIFNGACSFWKIPGSFDSDELNFSVAENIWQSTANNLVIPEGLVCDVQYLDMDNIPVPVLGVNSGEHLNGIIQTIPLSHIKVTGKQDGYRYEWESES